MQTATQKSWASYADSRTTFQQQYRMTELSHFEDELRNLPCFWGENRCGVFRGEGSTLLEGAGGISFFTNYDDTTGTCTMPYQWEKKMIPLQTPWGW
jgi:hypothetical protein